MLQIRAIPAFEDNYIWLVSRGDEAVVVDPGCAAPVLAALSANGLRLRGVLITHHHHDHVGGVVDLLQHASVPVFGPAGEEIPVVSRRLSDGERVQVLDGHPGFEVLAVPGHTLGHIAYFDGAHLFCGDTLFPCGCGRVFEGTMAQMHGALARLAALPPETLVYCAHEYSLGNVRFALAAEPANRQLLARERRMTSQRAAGEPTVPSTLREELDTNPFLRCAEPALRSVAASLRGEPVSDEAEVFAALRAWKDRF